VRRGGRGRKGRPGRRGECGVDSGGKPGSGEDENSNIKDDGMVSESIG
jgi:hypothetical protein